MSQRCKRRRLYARLGPQVVPHLRRMAHRLAADDPDMRDDLVQEGSIAVWRMEPRLLYRARKPKQLARRVGVMAMIRYRQREWKRSGDRILVSDRGWSLVYPGDPATRSRARAAFSGQCRGVAASMGRGRR